MQAHSPAIDTAPEIESMQAAAWRRMTSEEKTAIIRGLTQATFAMALAGVRDRHPDASPHEQRLRLAIVLHGRELATRAFPETAALAFE